MLRVSVLHTVNLDLIDSRSVGYLVGVVKLVGGEQAQGIISASVVSIDYAGGFRFEILTQGFLREKGALLTSVDVMGTTECEGGGIEPPGFYVEDEQGFAFGGLGYAPYHPVLVPLAYRGFR